MSQRHPHRRPVLRAGRRAALRGLAAIALYPFTAAAQSTLPRTPAQTEGPFYPRTIPSDHDADLTQVAGRSGRARGTPLSFSGRVLARDGRPLAGATVELWQCDSLGRYHHIGDQGGPLDDDFQGYGTATTDAAGRYAFTTIRPVAYPGRPPHLHVKVHASGATSLTTQVYIRGDSIAGDAVIAGSPAGTLDRLSMALTPAADRGPGALAGTFDFVL
ncbi:MAG: intradiol ring-cleavage dioxygenase [Betaproteobacteria bacterium]